MVWNIPKHIMNACDGSILFEIPACYDAAKVQPAIREGWKVDAVHNQLDPGRVTLDSAPAECCCNLPECDSPRATPCTILGFVHVTLAPGWKSIFQELIALIKCSGLYDRSETIWVGLLGPAPEQFEYRDLKLNVVYHGADLRRFEFPTLELLQNSCYRPSCLCYYLHLKGVFSERQYPNVGNWRKYMQYFVVERHQECIAALRTHDVCGVNWQRHPWPHFSGNFWWATAEYIRTLPRISDVAQSYRWNAERWIGMGREISVMCLHQSHINHYLQSYPKEAYVK